MRIAVLATLDTKADEARYLREQIERAGGRAMLVDMGVVGRAGVEPDVTRERVAEAGGNRRIFDNPTRQTASPVMIAGATKILREAGVAAVIGLGGTQGTSNCTAVMRALPYGLPKIMVSTVASGDTSAFVGIKDITMMFSVGDLLGLNPLTRRILANAAGMACGAARVDVKIDAARAVGMTNLGVLTDGAMHALTLMRDVIVFHAVGSGGRAMEQLMREGVIGSVFDYALGEISDELFGGLRAGGPERLTVAGELGLRQVIVPGGTEHIGLFVEANTVPEKYRGRKHVFHNPVIFAPRLNAQEMVAVAREIAKRLARTTATFMIPLRGVSRYSIPGGPLHDPEGDAAFFAELRARLPTTIEIVERDLGAEDPEFVREAVERLQG